MIRLDAELRDQNIRIAEERGRPELADQKTMAGNPIKITDSVKQRLRKIIKGGSATNNLNKNLRRSCLPPLIKKIKRKETD